MLAGAHAVEERAGAGRGSARLSPIEIDQRQDPLGPDPALCGRRASIKGFLPISLTDYLQLLDWTGQAIRADKRGSIPKNLAPILSRLGLDANRWCEVVARFGQMFKRAAGTTEHLAAEARRRGQRWMR